MSVLLGLDRAAGMTLSENIYYEEKLLLTSGTVITPSYISRLHMCSIFEVSVYEEPVHIDKIFTNPVESFYRKAYKDIQDILNTISMNKKVDVSKIFMLTESILEAVFTNQDDILLLTGYTSTLDNYFYVHALDVCLYSLLTAKAMDLEYEEILILGMGALLHDVGKSKVPDEILFKNGSLTMDEFEEMKNHPLYGYNIIKEIPGLNPDVAKIVLQHHERCDGSGYPNQLREGEIDKLSKIISIADIYDALTSDHIYKKKVLPHEAAEYLLAVSNSQLDPEISKVFLGNIAIYPKGCQVLLNTNEVAIVLDSSPKMVLRPLLAILTNKNRKPLEHPFEFDLRQNLSVFITHILG